ncbi:hypothetical protein [Mesorhizobium sp. L48C026A00]|uniref:hypothetical protein n=1 Tax=Mesorhizobium sp. L48C026A00 TaxID=1287182 RepID=UPI0003D03206|nr:hypothetical protein [Mesorhizobium sp. L48C026A00]ESZ10239.1 hypothetical protein X737_31870 [Mesorhizobium sp. L48C026A00]
MRYFEFLNWLSVGLMLFGIFRSYRGVRTPYSWFWALFAFGISSSVVLTSLDSLGLRPTESKASDAEYELMYTLQLVESASILIGYWFLSTFFGEKIHKIKLPELYLSNIRLYYTIYWISSTAVLLQIYLQLNRYSGYFKVPDYLTNPPYWLDFVEKYISLGNALFLIVAVIGQITGRPRPAFLLAILWVGSGFLSGFKSSVFLPVAMIVVASWLAGNVRWRYMAYVMLAMIAAYTVIEPLRKYRELTGEVDVVEAYNELGSRADIEIYTTDALIERVVKRFDYTEISVRALERYEFGLLGAYKVGMEEVYRGWFAMAVIPRLIWPSKPLANLGAVLSTELSGNPHSSIAPSRPVGSYIWAGLVGVAVVGFLTGVFLTIASILMSIWVVNPVKLFPVFVAALSLSQFDEIGIYQFITITRTIIVLVIFVCLGRMFGILRYRRDVGDRGGYAIPPHTRA